MNEVLNRVENSRLEGLTRLLCGLLLPSPQPLYQFGHSLLDLINLFFH